MKKKKKNITNYYYLLYFRNLVTSNKGVFDEVMSNVADTRRLTVVCESHAEMLEWLLVQCNDFESLFVCLLSFLIMFLAIGEYDCECAKENRS